MDKVVSVSFGELTLKGLNRSYFENKLIKQVRDSIKEFTNTSVYKDQGKLFIYGDDTNINQIIDKVKKIFGIVLVSPCYRIEKEINEIIKYSIIIAKETIKNKNIKTFKVVCKRSDKRFPINSMEVAKMVGHHILEEIDDIKVDVHKPDLFVYIDIRGRAYVYTQKIRTFGGLPVGTNGKGLLLLSGGIDSPVAGFMIAKRGVEISAVHYHSYPFTSERAEQKVKNLAKILTDYCGDIKFYSVNLLNIQKAINEKCPEDEMTLISRRFMMKIAQRIAEDNDIDALITGESLGQVASQTIKSLNVTNTAVDIPVFRPLIGMDKTEITDIANNIDTFETSILPYEDCCTVFLPKHPVTRPRLKDIERSEEALDVESLISDAIEKMNIININS